MLKYICISLLWIMCACSETISPPKNLIKEDKMAELITDFAINEQMSIINPNGDSEASTLYLFQKYKVSAKDFSDSQTYYMTYPNKMEKIYEKSQEILLEKYPELKANILKKIQSQPAVEPIKPL